MHVNTLVRKSRMQGFILQILPTTNIQQNRFLIDIKKTKEQNCCLCVQRIAHITFQGYFKFEQMDRYCNGKADTKVP